MYLMNLRKTRNLKAAGRYKFAVQSAKFTLIQTTHRRLAPHSLKRFMEDAGLGYVLLVYQRDGGGSMGKGFQAPEDSFPPSVATLLPCLPLANVDGNKWTNSREMCLSVARRINKGSRFVFQEPKSSLKAISQLRNETSEIAKELKYFGLMQTGFADGGRHLWYSLLAQTPSTESI